MIPRSLRRPRARGANTSITAASAVRFGFFAVIGGAAALILVLAVKNAATVLLYVGIAYFLALVIEPLIRLLVKHRVPRWLAVLFVFIVLSALVALALAVVVPVLAQQLTALIKWAPGAITDLYHQQWVQDAAHSVGADATLSNLTSSVVGFLSNPSHLQTIGGGLLSIGSSVLDAVTGTVITLVLTIYFTASLPKMTDKAFTLVPASTSRRAREVYERMTLSVSRYMTGQLELALINAALTLILLLVFHVPGAQLLTVVAFIGALIPVLGTVAAGVIVIAVALFTSPAAFIAAIIFYCVYHPLEGYIIGPRVMAHAVHVSGAIALIAVTAGGVIGGVVGALVAVPIAAAITILVDEVIAPRQLAR